MVDKAVLAAKLAAIRDTVVRVREVIPGSADAFRQDRTAREVVTLNLFIKPADFFGNDDVLYLMEDMATGEIRLSILWEWLHKKAPLTDADPETGAKAGDVFSRELFDRLLREEYSKLQSAGNRDVHDNLQSRGAQDHGESGLR